MKKFVLPGGASVTALMERAPAGALFARPRADAGDPKALIEQINRAVTELRSDVETKFGAKADDVVVTEKLDRINADISALQSGLDDLARRAATGAGGGNDNPVNAEYTENFVAYARGQRGEQEVRASLNKSDGSQGGFLAPVEWDRTITNKVVELSAMRQIASVIQIGTAGYKKLANLRGTASGWVGEAAARPETATPTFGEILLTFGELYANPATTQQMLDDAEIDLQAWLTGEIATEFAKAEGVAFCSGNGTNRPSGFLAYVAGGAKAGANPIGNIATVATGSAATLGTNPDRIRDLITQLPSVFRAGAVFVMNRLTEGTLHLMKDGEGRYLWQPSLVVGSPATLMGYPVIEMPDMPDVAANSLPIAFGNFQAGYQIVERKSTAVLVDPYTNKPYVHFYATKRVGGGVVQPEAIKILRVAAS